MEISNRNIITISLDSIYTKSSLPPTLAGHCSVRDILGSFFPWVAIIYCCSCFVSSFPRFYAGFRSACYCTLGFSILRSLHWFWISIAKLTIVCHISPGHREERTLGWCCPPLTKLKCSRIHVNMFDFHLWYHNFDGYTHMTPSSLTLHPVPDSVNVLDYASMRNPVSS